MLLLILVGHTYPSTCIYSPYGFVLVSTTIVFSLGAINHARTRGRTRHCWRTSRCRYQAAAGGRARPRPTVGSLRSSYLAASKSEQHQWPYLHAWRGERYADLSRLPYACELTLATEVASTFTSSMVNLP
jgi:hypothetical protein